MTLLRAAVFCDSLFYDAVVRLSSVALKNQMTVHNEMEIYRKRRCVVQFEALFGHYLGGTD